MSSANEAESTYRAIDFQSGVGAVMGTIASVHYAKQNLDKALEVASAATQVFKEIKEFSGQASTLKIAVDMKIADSRYYHALLLVEDMVRLYNQAEDVEGEAAAQLLAADLQVTQGDLQNAMDRSSAAAELFDKVGNAKQKAAAVLVMARAFEGAGQIQDATQAAEAAVGLFQEGRDKRGQAAALSILADGLHAQSQFGPAAYKLEEAAFIFRSLKDKKEEARVMAKLADMQLKMFNNQVEAPLHGWSEEEKEKCVKNAARAVELLGEAGAPGSSECGYAMLSHAEALNLSKYYDEAIAKAGQAQTLFQELGDFTGQSYALIIVGNAYNGKPNSHDAAIETMEKARELAEEAGENLAIKEVSKKIKEIGRYAAQSKRTLKTGGENRTDICIFRGDVPYCEYDAFEGRQMRTGPAPSSSSKALQPGDKDYSAPTRQKVMYNLRMQRVPNIDMTTTPPALTA